VYYEEERATKKSCDEAEEGEEENTKVVLPRDVEKGSQNKLFAAALRRLAQA
jgi:hypothetical protein